MIPMGRSKHPRNFRRRIIEPSKHKFYFVCTLDPTKMVAAYKSLLEAHDKLRKALAGHLFDGESLTLREAIRSQLIVEQAKEIDALRNALIKADRGIVAGQAVRSPQEFDRWYLEVQNYRPHGDLLYPPTSPREEADGKTKAS